MFEAQIKSTLIDYYLKLISLLVVAPKKKISVFLPQSIAFFDHVFDESVKRKKRQRLGIVIKTHDGELTASQHSQKEEKMINKCFFDKYLNSFESLISNNYASPRQVFKATKWTSNVFFFSFTLIS
jgi:hypothetical protein